MQMTMHSGVLSAERAGRVVVVAEVSEADRYRALRLFGVRPAVAAAVASGLVTVKVNTKAA